MPGKFELYKGKGGKFRFRLKATNGQIILASQGYKTKFSAKNGIASVQRNSADDARFVQSDAGISEQFFGIRPVHRVLSDADAHADADFVTVDGERSLEGLSNTGCDRRNVVPRFDLGEHQHELVAADSGNGGPGVIADPRELVVVA